MCPSPAIWTPSLVDKCLSYCCCDLMGPNSWWIKVLDISTNYFFQEIVYVICASLHFTIHIQRFLVWFWKKLFCNFKTLELKTVTLYNRRNAHATIKSCHLLVLVKNNPPRECEFMLCWSLLTVFQNWKWNVTDMQP